MKRGIFITLEGAEGCGKSTQIALLKEFLASKGIEVVVTREPGGTVLGEKIRSLLKDEYEGPPCDRAELLLFLAARAQLVRNVIVPALEKGAWVVSDRFSDSTFAYQGYGRGLDLEVLRSANDFACAGLVPDLTLLLETTPEKSLARMAKREAANESVRDRIEKAGDAFHSRLREGFRCLALNNPERIKTIDADGSIDEVREEICKQVKRFL